MASTPQKDAIVFILDVNPSLWQTAEGNGTFNWILEYLSQRKLVVTTRLDKGIHAITQMIHQKVLAFSSIC